jgi:outer membrane protein OmpA-like peptidoglycan-associated protein
MRKLANFIFAFLILAGCKTMNKSQMGTAGGAAVGATVGAVVGNNSVVGALIGATVGGTAGYYIGRSMDNQAKELKQNVPTAQVQRVGEGINITFDSGLLFAIDSDVLSDSAKESMTKAAEVFKKYPDTYLLIEGHTDDTGADDYNMKLSKRRATMVANFLQAKGVASNRLTTKWYGEAQPKFPNDKESNRKLNRRVEVGIYANDSMKKDAAEGKIKEEGSKQ